MEPGGTPVFVISLRQTQPVMVGYWLKVGESEGKKFGFDTAKRRVSAHVKSTTAY